MEMNHKNNFTQNLLTESGYWRTREFTGPVAFVCTLVSTFPLTLVTQVILSRTYVWMLVKNPLFCVNYAIHKGLWGWYRDTLLITIYWPIDSFCFPIDPSVVNLSAFPLEEDSGKCGFLSYILRETQRTFVTSHCIHLARWGERAPARSAITERWHGHHSRSQLF